MATTAGGIGFLVIIGLVSVGFSDADDSTKTTDQVAWQQNDDLETCDGRLVVEVPTGTAGVPGDTDAPDGRAGAVCGMQIGRGDEQAVTALQEALVQCHGILVTVDGGYGPETAAAVRAVQQQAGVTADGEYGPITFEVMRWPAASGSRECVGVRSPGTGGDGTPALPATG